MKPVVVSFLTWWQQLPAADQRDLLEHLTEQLDAARAATARRRPVKFGGRTVGPLPTGSEAPSCPRCGYPAS